MEAKFEKIVTMRPAYDRRDPDPSKNCGVHGVDLLMVLKGPLGAVQFLLYTQWHLPHVREEIYQRNLAKRGRLDEIDLKVSYEPMPADLGYHSPAPRYEGQTVMTDSCEYVNGKPCYYDGSGLQAEKVFEVLVREGSDGVWCLLEERYVELFETAQEPAATT